MNQLSSITPLEIILIALAAVGIFFFFRACWRIIKRSRQHLGLALLTLFMTLTAQTAWAADKTLSGSESYTAQNGDVLTGSTSGTVTIAADAKITLSNATINGGIVCEGSAEITLVGTNSVSVSVYNKAGIQIGGSGTTLTIKGDGSLNATGGSAAAGIGLGRTWDANAMGGSVVIEGGTVTASGGNGIGIGTVGNGKTAHVDGIIIKGGTVSAKLGSGYIYYESSVTIGAIKIYDTIDKVDASTITESVTYMHVENETETDVTATASTYFTIIEDGDRRVIAPKDDTDYSITIADGIEHGSIACAAETAKYGEKITITATPDFGYRFSGLAVKDAQNNSVESTGNSFFMPKSNVTVSAEFEQGTHGTTEFKWFYLTGSKPEDIVLETIYDGVTTVNIQNSEMSYQIRKYEDEYNYQDFLLDNDTYEANIPYAGGTGVFPENDNGTNFKVDNNSESGFYDITMTDAGNGKWNVSILKTAGQMDVVPDQTYTGSEITPEPLVMAGSLNLTKGTDYTYSYENNENVGTAKVRVTFKGTYESLGYVEKEFTIVSKSVTNNDITVTIPEQTYTGSELTPVITVKDGETVLTENTDYTVTAPSGPIQDAGNYTYTINGMGNYAGSKEATFTILPSTVIVNVTGNGTVTYNDKSAASGETIGVTAEKGTDVTLTLTPENGYAVSIEYGYTNNSGTTASGLKLPISGATATLTVPDDLKGGTGVTVTVTFVPALNGGADEASAVALTDATVTDLGGGWYKVENDISFDHTLNLLADTYLTIAEGKTMTVNTASGTAIDSEYTLNVSGEGALSVTTTEAYKIAVRVGSYVQTGATVTASGYIGIRCMDNFEEFNVTNDFTFSGGQLTATGSGSGNGIDVDNDITLSCSNATDFIQASSYRSTFGAVKVADGKALTDGTEASNGMNGYSGTLTDEQRTAIGGKTLHRAVTTSYVEASGTLHENVIAIPLDNSMTTLAAGWYVVNEDVTFTSKITLDGDVNLILSDGKTMTVTNTGTDHDDRAIYGNEKTLHIYGQSQGTGALTATAVGGDAAICLLINQKATSLLGIHGGVVSASTEYASGNGILVQCETDAGGIVIDGGQVTASGNNFGIYCEGGHFDILGGQVTATGTNIGGLSICDCNLNPGVLTLGYSKATDFVSTNSIYNYSGEGEVKIATDQTLVDGNGNIWSGTLSNDEIQSIRNQTLRPVTGVALAKDGSGNISATFNGTSLETVNIPVGVTVNSVTLNRTFTPGKASTVMLPFDYTCTGNEGGTFYKFVSMEKENEQWVATMKATGDDTNNVGTLTKNTPYLFLPTATGITFSIPNEGVTLCTEGGGNCQTADAGSHWTFKGTNSYIKWTSNTADADYTQERADEIGKVYGFAGVQKDGIDVGDFVKAKSGAKIRPMTCYLIWNSTPNNTRGMTRGTIDELPSSIVVRLLSSVGPGNQGNDDNQGNDNGNQGGDDNGETTAIGTLDTETGEIDFGDWYDMSGRKLSVKPTQKGLYIHNGKKVIIK